MITLHLPSPTLAALDQELLLHAARRTSTRSGLAGLVGLGRKALGELLQRTRINLQDTPSSVGEALSLHSFDRRSARVVLAIQVSRRHATRVEAAVVLGCGRDCLRFLLAAASPPPVELAPPPMAHVPELPPLCARLWLFSSSCPGCARRHCMVCGRAHEHAGETWPPGKHACPFVEVHHVA